jgi:hypothetical protein
LKGGTSAPTSCWTRKAASPWAPTWCSSYEPLASLSVIEIEGFAKADTPQGFRFLGSNELAEQYYVILDVKHRTGQRSFWQEGRNNLLIPMARESNGEWRLGPASVTPTY